MDRRAVYRRLGLAWVIVLSCMGLGAAGTEPRDIEYRLCEVRARRYSSRHHTQTLKGFLATDGQMRQRIAFYWLDPPLIGDESDHLAYSDLIIHDGTASCWIHEPFGDVVTFRLKLPEEGQAFRLPDDNRLASLLQSVFLAVHRARSPEPQDGEPWETTKFFQACRGQETYAHTMPAPVCPSPFDKTARSQFSESQVLDELPFGRTYRKDAEANGTYVWQVSKTSVSRDVVRLVVRPCDSHESRNASEAFDPNTLGRWSVVPDAYRTYWRYRRRYTDLRRRKEKGPDTARQLFTEIDECLNEPLPDDLALAMSKLRFDVSLETGTAETISCAARQYFAAYMDIAEESVDATIVELGRITKKLRDRRPQDKTRKLIHPLLETLIEPAAFSNESLLQEAFSDIRMQGWFWYGQLVVDVIGARACADPNFLAATATDLQTRHLARAVSDPDPNDYTLSVRDLLNRVGAPAPNGPLDANELKLIVGQAFSEELPDVTSDVRERLVGGILRSLRTMAGDGPYAGDKEKLKEALATAVTWYAHSKFSPEQIHSTLTTFLLLSFYDTSTQDDHTMLLSQLREISMGLEREACTILKQEGCAEIVDQSKVSHAFEAVNQSIGRHVADPLCPMFKFPLTDNEKTRLIHTTKLMFGKLQSDASVLGVKARQGADTRMPARMVEADLSLLAEEVSAGLVRFRLPRGIAELRGGRRDRPSVFIRTDVYEEADEEPDLFRKMMYFHLGHRIKEDSTKLE